MVVVVVVVPPWSWVVISPATATATTTATTFCGYRGIAEVPASLEVRRIGRIVLASS